MTKDCRVVVITGAARGIGLALTKQCLALGMRVVMVDYSVEELDAQFNQLHAQSPDKLHKKVCDVSCYEEVVAVANRIMQQWGRVDWLINNAGISGRLAPVWELSPEEVKRVIDVNVLGAVHCIKAFLPGMLHQIHPSHVVNMASVYGLCSGSQMSAYAMSKHAIVALSESLYFDLRRTEKPIHVSVVCPSFVNTSLLVNGVSGANPLNATLQTLLERGRSADDVAAHIVREVDKNTFYILPDREVKDYCEQRTQAIIAQKDPAVHSLEKILCVLARRSEKNQ